MNLFLGIILDLFTIQFSNTVVHCCVYSPICCRPKYAKHFHKRSSSSLVSEKSSTPFDLFVFSVPFVSI